MTVAAYSFESRWQIPAYVWPAVVGASVAVHLAFVVYGLPNVTWNPSDPEIPPEMELIIESGGPVFQEMPALVPEIQEAASFEQAEIVEPLTPESEALVESTVDELKPLQSVAVAPVEVPVESVVTEPVPLLSETTAGETVVIEADEVETVPVESAETAPSVPADTQLADTLTVTEVLEAQADGLVGDAQTDAEVPVATIDGNTPLNLVAPLEAPAAVQGLEVSQQQTLVIVETPLSSSPPLIQAEPIVSGLLTETTAGQEITGTEVTQIEQVENATVLDTAQDIQETDGIETTVEAAQPVASADVVVPVLPSETITETPSGVDETLIVGPGEPIALTPVENEIAETVTPEILELDPVVSEETIVAALSPTEPETSVVPSVPLQTEPANVVPPVEIATIDPLARVTNYVRDYEFGDCAHLSVLSAGADDAQVTAFGTGIGPFVRFDQSFLSDQGYEASIQLRLVTEQQCALLNALGVSEGLEAAGLVELDKTVVKSGTLATGLIQRDLPIARIAAAEASGLDLGGKGPPELYLIDDAGQIHDGRDFLLPASNALTAGGWRFKVPVVLMSKSAEETALVLAVWNRPAASQPPRFGTLPSSRIAGILEAPGVYSLAAFKVSR